MTTPDRTTQTYNRIARTYRAANFDRRAIQPQIAQFAQYLPAQSLILDVGCGPAMDTQQLLQANLRVVGVDLSWGMLAAGRERCTVPLVQADMRQLPFNTLFDGIWANASLLHLSRADAVQTLAQFAELIRPKGHLYLAVKQGSGSSWAKRSYGHAEPRFFNYWDSAELATELTQANFTIREQTAYQGSRDSWLNFFAQRN